MKRGIPIQDHPVTNRSRRWLLLSVMDNIWLLTCRDMAIWPLSCLECIYLDSLGTNCIDSSRSRAVCTNCGRMAISCRMRVVCKETRKNISDLRFWPNKRMKSGFSAIFFGAAQATKRGLFGQQVFHDYSTICQWVIYALFWANFRLFSTVGYYARVVPFLLPHIIMFFYQHSIFVWS